LIKDRLGAFHVFRVISESGGKEGGVGSSKGKDEEEIGI